MDLKSWCDAVQGRQSALAAHLKQSLSAVSQAVNGGMRVPPSWYRGIVEFTGNEVTYEDLLPKVRRKSAASKQRKPKAAAPAPVAESGERRKRVETHVGPGSADLMVPQAPNRRTGRQRRGR